MQASAEKLPFAADSFDASMAVLTAHHWADLESGAWEERYGHLRERAELDVGLRLVSSAANRQESKS